MDVGVVSPTLPCDTTSTNRTISSMGHLNPSAS